MTPTMLEAAGSNHSCPYSEVMCSVREIIYDDLIDAHVSMVQDSNMYAFIIYVTDAGLISVPPPGSFVMINHTLRDCR